MDVGLGFGDGPVGSAVLCGVWSTYSRGRVVGAGAGFGSASWVDGFQGIYTTQLVAKHHNTTITQQRATNNALSQYNKVIMFVSSSNKLTPKKNTQINVPMRDILLLWYKCSV